MAKPNLTSIFTSSNQYSVLKLLKALCDAVDNIDYADNTEFTNFKEQVNAAVASLTSTDNSLQEQIDNNNGLINDVSAQMSVIERPDTNTTVVNKGLTVKDNGDVTVGRNLEVGGTTKLNGGFEPIHTYNFNDDGGSNYTLNILFEISDTEPTGFIGELSMDGEVPNLCLGKYKVSSGRIDSVSIIYCSNSANPYFESYTRENGNDFLFYNYVEYANKRNTQSKLYRHKITLNGIYVLMYNSTSSIIVRSIADLRTIMKISSESNEEILPVCASDATSMVTLVVTNSLCQVDGTDVTSVSDNVTPL